MHRSKLCTIMVDCNAATWDAAVTFWGAALGRRILRSDDPTDPYVTLEGGAGGLRFELQRVQDTSRIHLDIETDNVEAEVLRLEALGARRHAQIESWWVMHDPAGHLFCVVPPQSPDFVSQAQTWDEDRAG